MFGALDISTSGLIAQRTRLEVVAANLAGESTLLNEAGEYEPFRRRFAVLAAGDPESDSGQGVHVARIESDQGPLVPRYEPWSDFADANGYVLYPNVNRVVEQMNAMEAARSYEANIAAIEATKSMMSIALQIIA
jgi:flagellar basal-body rod protein FlgC